MVMKILLIDPLGIGKDFNIGLAYLSATLKTPLYRWGADAPTSPPLIFFETPEYPKDDRIFIYKLACLLILDVEPIIFFTIKKMFHGLINSFR